MFAIYSIFLKILEIHLSIPFYNNLCLFSRILRKVVIEMNVSLLWANLSNFVAHYLSLSSFNATLIIDLSIITLQIYRRERNNRIK